jgi:hypothetical protein
VTAHTPGPWHTTIASGGGIQLSIPGTGAEWWSPIVSGEGEDVAYLPGEAEDPTVAANARLIAAAPEILNAAKLAVMMLGVEAQVHRENQQPKKAEAVEKAISVIRAAIAKAEGVTA